MCVIVVQVSTLRYCLGSLPSFHLNLFQAQVWAYTFVKILLKHMMAEYGLKTTRMEKEQHSPLHYLLLTDVGTAYSMIQSLVQIMILKIELFYAMLSRSSTESLSMLLIYG